MAAAGDAAKVVLIDRDYKAKETPATREPRFFWAEAVALVDAADQPLAAEDVVIDVVLVDAVAKAGWAELEGLKSVVATPVLA
jgi:hypothetical protein